MNRRLSANDHKPMNSSILDVSPLGFQWKTLDPFLFCVHHLDHFPRGNGQGGADASLIGRSIGYDFTVKDGWRMYHGRKVPGFPVHPHRGFETVTIVRRGMVDHADSLGCAGRYGQGDVQWMTAGKGIQHSEMMPLLNTEGPNTLELFQIWLNLPNRNKFVDPEFVMFWSEDIPKELIEGQGRVHIEKVSSVSLRPPVNSWAADPANHVRIELIRIEGGSSFTLDAAEKGLNRAIYFFEGSGLDIDGQAIPDYHSVVLRSDQAVSMKAGARDLNLLLLQGRPIGEDVYQYGPFVMGSRQEIDDAYNDYQETRFGGWPWNTPEPVHDLRRGRFARFVDGSEQMPG
jgi:quercetin 2,3-dioxygenase